MGSGKSTLGKRLARKIEYHFVDMDTYLEEQEGMEVKDIFSQKGEKYFRELESGFLKNLCTGDNLVVATGGGAPCHGNNLQIMNEKGITVYLKMSAASLASRLEKARTIRPLIEGLDPASLRRFIGERLKERESYYEQAQCIIKGENVKPAHVIALVFGNS